MQVGNETHTWKVDEDALVDETSTCNMLVVVFAQGNFTIQFDDVNKYTYISAITGHLTNPGKA